MGSILSTESIAVPSLATPQLVYYSESDKDDKAVVAKVMEVTSSETISARSLFMKPEKDDKIDSLITDIKNLMKINADQSNQIADQSEQIAELLQYAKESIETLHEVLNDLTETKEEVQLVKTYLQDEN